MCGCVIWGGGGVRDACTPRRIVSIKLVRQDEQLALMADDYPDESPKDASRRIVQKLAGPEGKPDGGQEAANQPHWLQAWSDPVAGIAAYTPCVHTCNLFGDGDWRLVVADEDRKLKVGKKRPAYYFCKTPVNACRSSGAILWTLIGVEGNAEAAGSCAAGHPGRNYQLHL